MNKIAILSLLILLISFASAEIIITQQPSQVYNLGESFTLPVTIKTTKDITSMFSMDLICNGVQLNFYKNGVSLVSGAEARFDPSLVLVKDAIGTMKGSCKIKGILGTEYVLTNDFTISSSITVQGSVKNPEISPGEGIIVEGSASKESGKEVNGFVEINVYPGTIPGQTPLINQLAAVNNGFFTANITSAENMKAGQYKITLRAYERDTTGELTNEGFGEASFSVRQVPKNLELIQESVEIDPGATQKITTILHDQTGDSIPANSTITIKDSKGKLREKADKLTNEALEFPIPKNEPPAQFTIIADSNGLESSANFTVKEKPDVDILLVNRTLTITNTGNVPYCNKTVLVKIGNQSLNIDVCLDVGKDQKYTITAPDGEYDVEVITEGQDKLKERVTLTGSAIGIKEGGQTLETLSRHPFIWIFVLLILGFLAFLVYQKGYKNVFIGKMNIRDKHSSGKISLPIKQPSPELQSAKPVPIAKGSPIVTNSKAEISLSLKGEKQDISIVSVRVKGLSHIKSIKEGGQDTIQRIVRIAEDRKAAIYETNEYLFFLLVPERTKTFKNEIVAVQIAEKALEILKHHNKIFKDKADFGISVNYGSIVAKQEPGILKFMPLGPLMSDSKRLSLISQEQVLLSEKIKEKLGPSVKAEKQSKSGVNFYTISSLKTGGEHEQFLKRFTERQK